MFSETALGNHGDRESIPSSLAAGNRAQPPSALLKWSAQNPRWALRGSQEWRGISTPPFWSL